MSHWLTSDIRSTTGMGRVARRTCRIPMLGRPTRAGLIAGLLGTTAWHAMPAPATAQSCGMQGSVYACTYSGDASAYSFFYANAGAPDAAPMTVTSTGDVSLAVSPDGADGLNFGAFGFSEANQGGGKVQGLQFTNSGSVTLTAGSSTGSYSFGLQVTQTAGNGNPGGSSTSLGGSGVPAGITINNSGAIDLDLSGIQVGGGAAISGFDSGGDGVSGGSGGSSAGVAVTNTGAITATVTTQNGFAGIAAQSAGGDGSTNGNNRNGAGGNAGPASVTSSAPISVTFAWADGSNFNGGLFGIQASARGGAGGGNVTAADVGGTGGSAGSASATLTAGANVSVQASGTAPTSGTPVPSGGVAATSVGGQGGDGGNGNDGWDGGNGGNAGGATISATGATVGTAGDDLPGLLALAQGGAGGLGDDCCSSPTVEAHAGQGGVGGAVTGAVAATLSGPSAAVTTSGDNAPGIYAISLGGQGGQGGELNDTLGGGTAGYGGGGGASSAVTVGLTSASITTQGASAPGIVAQSEGGGGGDGNSASATGEAVNGNGGNGGAAAAVTVTLDSASSIQTAGSDAIGILAQSLGGAAGEAGQDANGTVSKGGSGGTGGNSGVVQVTNNGSISTAGANARGIIAQSLAGGGGTGGAAWGTAHAGGGAGAAGGTSGEVDVINTGSITTAGSNAHGILLQSIGGGGGAGGSGSGVIKNVGGSGAFGTTGGTVNFTANGGSISTSGISAVGVLGQSIGGGGGDGGGASGIAVSIGGTGGSATDASQGAATLGGTVTATLNQGTTISTTGDLAAGVIMQSIGGGGGNGGNASSDGLFASVAIGGTAGKGSTGGTVNLNATGATITTAGSHSAGLVAQSIGGGGGTGGAALSGSIGPGFDTSVSLGGNGGSGANGGSVGVTLAGTTVSTGQNSILVNGSGSTLPVPCNQTPSQPQGQSSPCNGLPVDSFGVVVQSIGGGGGLGGTAMAQSIAISVPVTGEGDQASLSVAVGVGGKGEGGGDGGTAQFSLSNGSTLTTYGQGSIGALVQSVGGGGGAGGDSSASASTIGFPNSVPDNQDAPAGQVAFTMGATGGAGGNGGTVQVALGGTVTSKGPEADPSGSAATSVTTYGDFADGVVAQSIGGGGGNAGAGGGTTQDYGTGNSTSFSFATGAQGGSGGNGGAVTVDTFSGSSIATFGSSALGIVAQSIGGGGGTSQAGSLSVAQSFKPDGANSNLKPGLSITMGTQGAGGGDGEAVTVNSQSPIATRGGDAVGILAQSIGGGGGLSGSAGSDASGDNPFIKALNGREWQSDINNYFKENPSGPQYDLTLSVAIGGSGGDGGDGGAVSTTVAAPISTLGDWASGIIAQSVGGGGGKGGSAVATGTGGTSEVTINLDYALGGTGGPGGSGGNVIVNLEQGSSISTAGFGAAGVVGQSIGGGGGIAGDGSDSATGLISVGGSGSGNSVDCALGNGYCNQTDGGGGGAGTVDFEVPNADIASIITHGDGADGVVLQSIGGGGGIGGAGSSWWTSNGTPSQTGTLTLVAGGGSSASGNGNTVTFDSDGGSAPITTNGNGAFGILAQSIGGGGGLVSATPTVASPTIQIGGEGSGNGGTVNVNLSGGSEIVTWSNAAFGIAAQSIGGGGGVVRVVGNYDNAPSVATGSTTATLQTKPASGNGGQVNVTLDAGSKINANTAGSIGVFAQSIGGGGGLILNGNQIYAGAPLQGEVSCSKNCPTGGDITVKVDGSVSGQGANGIGVFAQSAGYGSGGSINVTVSGEVYGGGGIGSGIQIDGLTSGNMITVASGGSISSPNAGSNTVAVRASQGTVTLNNSGTVTGSLVGNIPVKGNAVNAAPLVQEGARSFTLNNNQGGVYNAGADIQGDVFNHGTVNVGLPGELRSTRVTGDFIQTGEGRLGVTVDSLNKTAGHLQVDGTATLDGHVAPTAITLLPGSLPVVTAGHLVSTAGGLDSLLFHWDTMQSGNTLSISPRSDFKPGGVALNDSQSSLAGYYGRAWDNGDKGFATRFAQLSTINDRSDYKAALDAWSSKAAHAQSIALANSAGTILGAAMSCPVFVDDTVLLGEDNCAWAKVTGRWTDQSSTSDTQGYYVSGTTYRIGAQHEIAPDWYLGASFGFGRSWTTMDGGSSGDGDTYDGSVTVKRVMGPWQFAGSVAFAGGSFHTDRRVDIPGIASETLQSDPSIFLAGGRLRAAYELAFQDWYIRPYGDLDVIYTDLPGFEEKGDDLYALDVRGSSKTSVALSPMVEFGGRLNLDTESTLRAYVAFGMSYQPDNTRTIHSSFVGASSANGTFSDQIDSPEVLGRIGVGVQLFRSGGFELKGEYTADIGGSFLSQSASARAAYHF
ncbi:hypothetical protein [Inquilinus sp.]|jgi:hypothetical protein|uniref:hypothetical protein n=1 Tax=Inquilinus sp. TaxID=1932117 RepID=UPI003783549E